MNDTIININDNYWTWKNHLNSDVKLIKLWFIFYFKGGRPKSTISVHDRLGKQRTRPKQSTRRVFKGDDFDDDDQYSVAIKASRRHDDDNSPLIRQMENESIEKKKLKLSSSVTSDDKSKDKTTKNSEKSEKDG